MTTYQKQIGKRSNWSRRQTAQTGALPLIPAAITGAKAIGTTLAGGLGIKAATKAVSSKVTSQGAKNAAKSAATKAGAAATSGGAANAITYGAAGYTLGDVFGDKMPDDLAGINITGLITGAGLIAGSGWLGVNSGFTLDSPLTAVSGAGLLAGSFMLYRSMNSPSRE